MTDDVPSQVQDITVVNVVANESVDAFTETIRSENQISLALDQSLILAMEGESRWMIKDYLTTEQQVPNFLDYINEEGLKKVKPESVNIIR